MHSYHPHRGRDRCGGGEHRRRSVRRGGLMKENEEGGAHGGAFMFFVSLSHVGLGLGLGLGTALYQFRAFERLSVHGGWEDGRWGIFTC